MQGFCLILAFFDTLIISQISLNGLHYKDFSIVQQTLIKVTHFSMYRISKLGQTTHETLNQNGGLLMILDKIALILTIIGALNWGGIGLFGFDTVAFLCGGQTALLSRIIYTLVGLAGLWCVSLLFRSNEETGHAPHTA